ncbi:HEAT repeat domain-containing protein [Myxococcus sp. MxC21-1]|uniref:HEAT repeat domain-containing protein n=1 Tax=Myxococcus sp. MxC21-1 TaxID=3041439 RepID=UPI00292EE7FD|nr:HEAT repeat domain-containing protein [Myxococcus sp. MxC21-1]WNZ62285.1 HEAT repeat domain-containing protein [Myxococcus sp. MxC21-1]
MSPRLKSLVLLLAVLTAAALWRAGQETQTPASPETPPAVSQSLGDEAPTPEPEEILPGVKGRERVLVVGHRLRYTFDLDLRTHTELSAGARESLHTGWSGLFELTYLGAEGEQHLFSGHLVPTRVAVAPGETLAPGDAALQALRGMFERPVYVGQDVRGRVMAVHFDAAQDAAARRLVRLLLASTQFVAEDGPRWSTEEPDSRGDLEAVYRAGGSANTYVKTKRRYLRAGSAALPRLQGHLDFTLFADGHVKEATGSEVVELGGADTGLPRIREETRVALTHVGVDYLLSSLRPFDAVRATLRSERLTDSAGMEGASLEAWDRQLVKGAKLDELLRSLAKREALDTARLRLAALFRQNLAEVDRAVALIRQGSADAVRSEQMLEALASAGTPEAQRALVSVLEGERVRPKTRAHAARAVGRMERPSPLLGDVLERVVDGTRDAGVRNAAALSMGTLSKALEVAEPGRSQALVEGLMRRCRTGTLEPEVCLDALARAGAPVGLAYVKSALVHPEAAVRGAATEALSAIPGAAVDALLDQVMLDDPSPRVRALAVKAVSQRVVSAHMEALARVLRAERSERVRIEVVRLLGQLQAVEAPAAALLRDVATNDGSSNVRALAASLLGE